VHSVINSTRRSYKASRLDALVLFYRREPLEAYLVGGWVGNINQVSWRSGLRCLLQNGCYEPLFGSTEHVPNMRRGLLLRPCITIVPADSSSHTVGFCRLSMQRITLKHPIAQRQQSECVPFSSSRTASPTCSPVMKSHRQIPGLGLLFE
jgi:hypothetical protein